MSPISLLAQAELVTSDNWITSPGILEPKGRCTLIQQETSFGAIALLDSLIEIEYYRDGDILQYLLRQFLEKDNQ